MVALVQAVAPCRFAFGAYDWATTEAAAPSITNTSSGLGMGLSITKNPMKHKQPTRGLEPAARLSAWLPAPTFGRRS